MSWARSPWSGAALGLAVVLFLVHAPVLFGYAAPMWDAVDFFAPYFILIADAARSGGFVLWNPFTLGGLPDYLEPQLGAFSPPVVLFGLVFGGTPTAFAIYWFAIWLTGGLGVLCLARHLGAPPWGGFACAVAFLFSAPATDNASHTAMLYTLGLLPWLVWRVDAAIAGPRLRPAVEAGVLFGLSGLGGYPGLVFLNGCFLLLWAVGRLVLPGELPRRRFAAAVGRAVLAGAVATAVAAAVLSPTYLPYFVEAPDVSDRAGAMTREDAVENEALHPAALVTLASPALLFADLFPYTDVTLRSLYVGSVALALALFALLRRPSAPFRWWLLVVGLLFLACAMGRALPLRGWLYEWLPPTRYFRAAALFRCYASFSLLLLAIHGVRDLAAAVTAGDVRAARRFAFVVAGLAAAVVAVFAGLGRVIPGTLALWVLLCVVAWAGWAPRWRRLVPAALVALALVDAWSTFRMVRPIMYNPQPDAWLAFARVHRSDMALTSSGLMRHLGGAANGNFVSKTPTLRGYSGLVGRLARLHAGDELLAASAIGPDRLWFSSTIGIVGRSEHCFELWRARAAVLGRPPLVVTPDAAVRSAASEATCDAVIPALPPASRLDRVAVLTYVPDRLTIRVEAPAAGWLLVTDTWSSRWRATVNDRERGIYRGNFVFRAVPVVAGPNTIDFRYDAVGFPWLLILSWGAVLVVGISAVASAVRSRAPLIRQADT